jgi:hypothetical protein
MKHIGFLSFGHWTQSPQSQTRSASDALLQSIELAVAAEELGADGAYFRVHHFARQLGSPFPLLAACGARTFTSSGIRFSVPIEGRMPVHNEHAVLSSKPLDRSVGPRRTHFPRHIFPRPATRRDFLLRVIIE